VFDSIVIKNEMARRVIDGFSIARNRKIREENYARMTSARNHK
jgi:hypothetical protein